MKKKTGIIILAVSVVLIITAVALRPALISLFPEGCAGMKKNNKPLTKEEELQQRHEEDNKEYEETNVAHTGKNIAFEYASTGRFSRYNGGIVSVTETELAHYSKTGEKKWSMPVQISSPVLAVADKYILIFEKDGNKISVYDGEKNIFSKTLEGKIKTASVSSGGDIVVVFEREGYKGSVMVYNKSGDEVYLWNSGKYGILDADISQTRKLAVSLLNTEGTVSSKIYFFDISKSGVSSSADVENSIAFDIVFRGEILNVFADDRILGLSVKGDIKWNYEAYSKNIVKYAVAEDGAKIVVYDKNNASEVTLISSGGAEKINIQTDVLPDIVDISNDRILYNDGRTLVITSFAGDVLARYTCSRDIKQAYIIEQNNIFIVYGSSVEFLDVKGE